MGHWCPGMGLSWTRDKMPHIHDFPYYTVRVATLYQRYMPAVLVDARLKQMADSFTNVPAVNGPSRGGLFAKIS